MHNCGAGGTAAIALVMALTVMAVISTGCASQAAAEKPATGTKPMQVVATGQTGGSSMPKMTCPMCAKGAPVVEQGTATADNGVQVVNVTLKDGYYSPNEITITAGMPAKLVFTGEAKDCSGKPKIADLSQQVDFTKTGEATMDLGSVKAGTYKITCGMGSAGGDLIVQ